MKKQKFINFILVFVLLFTYFSPFFEIFDIKAEEQIIEEVSKEKYTLGGIELDENYVIHLKPQETATVTLETEEDYYIQGCEANDNVVLHTNIKDEKSCELIVQDYGKVLVTLYISNSDGSSVVKEYFYVDVELDKYMENVLAKIPDKIENYDEYSNFQVYGMGYNIEGGECKGNVCTYDFILSYYYPVIENLGNHVSPYTKSKKFVFDNNARKGIPNEINLDKGDKGKINLYNMTDSYDDFIWVSENNDVATIDQDGNYEAVGAGKTNFKFYNKKTFEYINSKVTVIESKFKSINELKNELDNSEITIDINHKNNIYYYYYNEDNKQYVISNYIRSLFDEKMALDLYYFNTIQNLNCDENGCDFTLEYNDRKDNYTNKEINIENLKINYTGIYIKPFEQINLNTEFTIDYISYLPENTEYTIVYDEEYLTKLENGNYLARKSGTTEVTVLAPGYSDTISLDISYSDVVLSEFSDYFLNLSEVELPYSELSFQTQSDLKVLEELIRVKIINDYPNQSIKDKLTAEVNCLSNNSCYIKMYNDKNNSLIGNEWTRNLISVEYTSADSNTAEEIKNLDELLNNTLLVNLDDTIKIENTCLGNSECFYNKLKDYTNLDEIESKYNFDMSYTPINTFEFKKLINGGINYLVKISKNNNLLYTKKITINSNHIVNMGSKLNKNEKSKYLKEYVDSILNSDTTNTLKYDNVYEVTNGISKFNLILDQKEYVMLEGITVTDKNFELKIGESKKLKYEYYPFNATIGELEFKIEDESIATVDENGVVTAKSKGYTFMDCVIGYSTNRVLIVVDMSIKEVLNKYLPKIANHQIVDYSMIRNHSDSLESAIATTAVNDFYTYNSWLPFEVDVKTENGKVYAAVKYDTTNYMYDYVLSDYKEITYDLVGISLEKSRYELSTNSKVDTKLFFTEGDNNNLYFSYTNEGIVELGKDGTLTALKPGVTSVFITDKYNKYFNYIDVVVDKDKCFDYIVEELNQNPIQIKGSSNSFNYSNGNFQDAAFSEFENKYRMYLPNSSIGIDCNENTSRCTYTIYKQDSTEVERNIVFNVEKVGIFLDQKTLEINLNDSIDIKYTQLKDTSNVKVTSLNPDVCEIRNGKIIGTGVGFCTVKYKSDNYFNYQHIIVSKDKILNGYQELLNTLDEPIEVPLLNFDIKNAKVSEDMMRYLEVELYQATIKNKIESIIGKGSNYYLWPNFSSLNDLSRVQIELSPYFNFQDHKNEYYYSNNELSNESIKKYVSIIPTNIESKSLELGSKLIKNVKSKYELDLVQYLKYRLSGDTYGLFEYSEFYENLMKECPTCTYGSVSGGYGGGSDGVVNEGGNFVIFKDGAPIMVFETGITASIDVLQDIEIFSEEDYINLLKKIIKDAYIKASKAVTPVATFSSVSYRATTLSDDINVEIEKSFDSMSKQLVYDVTVEDIKFKAPVKTKVTGDLNYTYSVTSITPDKSEITLNKGTEATINYTIAPSNATNKEVIFKSSDENIVKVDSKGKISAIGAGEAYITITSKDENVSTKIKVIVKEIKVEKIVLDKNEIILDQGTNRVIGYSIVPDNATNKEVIFKSSNENIVKVDSKGNISTIKSGTAYITITSKDKNASTKIKVIVKEIKVEKIVLDKDEITLDQGTNRVIGYSIVPDNATSKEVIFKSSDENIVKVDSKGNISAIKSGTAYITIISKDKNVITKVKVIVKQKEVVDIEVKLGDINCDGKINMTDIIRLRKYFAGKETLNNQSLKNADINKDGKVNMTDIIKLRKYLAGKEKI